MRMPMISSRRNNYNIIIASTFLIGAMFFYMQKNGNINYAAHGKITNAQIVDVLGPKTARYQYRVNNQNYTGDANIEYASHMLVEIKKGQTIPIEYLENDPSQSRVHVPGILRGGGGSRIIR